MGLFDLFKAKKLKEDNTLHNGLYGYSEKHYKSIEDFVAKQFGKFDNVYHETMSFGVHLDMAVIPPSENANFYKLVTLGMGSYKMNVPQSLKNEELERAELVMFLPPNWDFSDLKGKDAWPITVLKTFARMPLECNSWVGFDHTASLDKKNTPFAENTKLCSGLFLPVLSGQRLVTHRIEGLGKINFYVIVPLYEEELKQIFSEGTDKIIEKIDSKELSLIVDINRKNYAIE
ncbi:MAG: suppressor of fused domain protein [Clostridia bacterium]|nr:suppressor of fused domain protein [Clostridia bacterium]